MKVITIMNYKGGVGKTATAVNLSYNLSERGYKTLLIDCDPQGNASYFYGKYDEKKKGLTGVLQGMYTLETAIRRTKFKNLDIVQADRKLEFVKIYSPIELKDQIHQLGEDRYDYVILDCHPTFELYTKIALVAADLCVVPVKLDQNSINGLAFFDEHFQDILDLAPNCEYKVLITLAVLYSIHMDGIYPENDQNIVTSGGSGFGIMAILAGIDRGYVTREEGLKRMERIITFLETADRSVVFWLA